MIGAWTCVEQIINLLEAVLDGFQLFLLNEKDFGIHVFIEAK